MVESVDGVLSRRELRDLGWDRNAVAREVSQERWRLHGLKTVALHTGELSFRARCRRAVIEVGEQVACLDGVTALPLAGLEHFTDDVIHVSVDHVRTYRAVDGVKVHKIRMRAVDERLDSPLVRTRPAVAAIRAAHWAVSDRQAATIMIMGGQQGLYRGEDLAAWRAQIRGRTRRAFIDTVIQSVTDGVQALGELDITGMCRRRGLPPPTHQIMRRGPRGRVYLDVGWEDIGLFVEIDGVQHSWGVNSVDDMLKANAVTIQRGTVLRMSVIGLALAGEAFLDQVSTAYDVLSGRAEAA
mgnify:CR=1 FL=1